MRDTDSILNILIARVPTVTPDLRSWIKPRGVHVSTLWLFLSSPPLGVCGFCNLSRGMAVTASFG